MNRTQIRAQSLAKATRALDLRIRGWTWREIARETGYRSDAAAYHAVDKLLAATAREPADQLRRLELERLDLAEKTVWAVIESFHFVVSYGQVMWDPRPGPDGEQHPLKDTAPILNAIDRLIKIHERRARLLGLDAPVNAKISITQQSEMDAEIEQLLTQLLQNSPREVTEDDDLARDG